MPSNAACTSLTALPWIGSAFRSSVRASLIGGPEMSTETSPSAGFKGRGERVVARDWLGLARVSASAAAAAERLSAEKRPSCRGSGGAAVTCGPRDEALV